MHGPLMHFFLTSCLQAQGLGQERDDSQSSRAEPQSKHSQVSERYSGRLPQGPKAFCVVRVVWAWVEFLVVMVGIGVVCSCWKTDGDPAGWQYKVCVCGVGVG